MILFSTVWNHIIKYKPRPKNVFGRRSSTDLVSMTFGRVVKIYTMPSNIYCRKRPTSTTAVYSFAICHDVSNRLVSPSCRELVFYPAIRYMGSQRCETNRIRRLTDISLCAHTQCTYKLCLLPLIPLRLSPPPRVYRFQSNEIREIQPMIPHDSETSMCDLIVDLFQ